MQSLLSRMGVVSASEHEVQFVDSPKHVAHVALHPKHTPSPEVEVRYWPTAHVEVHVPAMASKSAPSTHDVQPVAVPSEHVRHDASHALQVLLPSANSPLGQLATHEPSS